MFEKDSFADLIRINKFCLQFFGILMLNGPPSDAKIRFSNLLTILTLLCVTSINIPVFHYIASANLDVEGTLDVLNVIAGVLGGELRMIFVALKRKKIQRLYATCESLWVDASLNDIKIIYVWINQARLLSFILCSTTVLAVSLYIFSPAIKQITPFADNCPRSWPYQINMDSSQSPRYEIFYVVQSVAVCFGICSIIGCDLIGPLVALHACGQLRLIQNWLVNISKDVEKPAVRHVDRYLRERFKKFVRRHQIVMDLCLELEQVVCYVNLAQALGGMYMMAISAARLTRVQNVTTMYKALGPLGLATSQLLLSCWPADRLFFESSAVATAIYAIPWYRCSPRMRKEILFTMARSQRPARLTAGKFVTFSLETFASIVSAASSFYMLLRSVDPAVGIPQM